MSKEGIMKQMFVRNSILPAALIFLAGCSIVAPFSRSVEFVTFSVPINTETFSPEASLRVRIWNIWLIPAIFVISSINNQDIPFFYLDFFCNHLRGIEAVIRYLIRDINNHTLAR